DVDDMNGGAGRKIPGIAGTLTIIEAASQHDDGIGILQDEVGAAIAVDADLALKGRLVVVEEGLAGPARHERNPALAQPLQRLAVNIGEPDAGAPQHDRPP